MESKGPDPGCQIQIDSTVGRLGIYRKEVI